jgi:hypothetical protein
MFRLKFYTLTNLPSKVIATVQQISHGGDCEETYLLIYNTVRSDSCSLAFWRNLPPMSSDLRLWDLILHPEGTHLVWNQRAEKNAHMLKRNEDRKERRGKKDNEGFHN